MVSRRLSSRASRSPRTIQLRRFRPSYSSSLDGTTTTNKNAAFVSTTESSDEENNLTAPIMSKDSLYRLVQLSRPEWKLIGQSAATLGVTSSITLLLPFASGQVIDYTVLQTTAESSTALSPIILAGGLFGLTTIAGGGVYLRSLWLARAGNRIVARLKQQLYASLLRQESAYFDQQTTGDLLSRLSADVQLIQSAVTNQAVAAMRGIIMTMGSASMLLYTSPVLAAVSCCTLPPIFIITRKVGRKLQDQQQQVQKLQGEASNLAEQALTGIVTVKQFVAETYETTRYRNAIAKAHAKALETAHMQAQLEAGAHVAGNGAILCVLGYGGTLVLQGSISAGDLTGFVMYSLLMAGNLSGLTSLYGDLLRAVASSQRVFDILDRRPLIESVSPPVKDSGTDPLTQITYTSQTSSPNSQSLRPISIELDSVDFWYPARPEMQVLSNFSLKVSPGEVVALVGGSGSGKSTVAGLLTRLYDVQSKDSILIDGKPASSYAPADLRRMIGIVSQEPTIFQGTIKDNIMYGEWGNVTEDQILDAARQAHVLEFADDFELGLDTFVGSRGSQLSGGQRQRIAIARVLLKNPPIVILDEATSALDAQSEHIIEQAMNIVMDGRTVISIAHRLSTIRNASRIAVIEDGAVVQSGDFGTLSKTDGPFLRLMKTQL